MSAVVEDGINSMAYNIEYHRWRNMHAVCKIRLKHRDTRRLEVKG